MVKPDCDTPATVPDDPPTAGPDRALDPPPTGLWLLALPGTAAPAVADGAAAAVDEEDAAEQADIPSAAVTGTVTMINFLARFGIMIAAPLVHLALSPSVAAIHESCLQAGFDSCESWRRHQQVRRKAWSKQNEATAHSAC
ncbi:hypothetical protein [Catenulispora sp. GP43]|uniref:hypothetical protein n=1 Tax=Catenulispora sp. GP43 TaxID=3156263 RepID=UPI003517D4BE